MTATITHYMPDDILYIRGEGNYSYIIPIRGKPLLFCRTLKIYESLFPEFIRCSRSHLVNPAHVQKLCIDGHRLSRLLLTNGESIPIARRRFALVQQHVDA